MITIKKMEIGYGDVFSSNYEIIKKGPELVYRYGKLSPREVKRVPDISEWRMFAEAITPLLKTWKKEYYNEEKNGVQWRVNIETSEGYFYSCGSNDFPEDFHFFLRHCRSIIRRNDFADDFRVYRKSPVREINRFNKKIIQLLKSRRKSVTQLAHFLDYNVDFVTNLLNSAETFNHQDLLRVCTFLNELPSDFMYETMPDVFSRVLMDLRHRSGVAALRIAETQRQIISYFEQTVILN
jgi:hypothetical protein